MNRIIKSAVMALGLVLALPLTSADCFAQYTDRTAFNLSGNVKSVVSKSESDMIFDGVELGYTSLTFTREGKVATWNEGEFPSSEYQDGFIVKRNAKGQITSSEAYYTGGYTKTYYTYNAQGRIASLKHEESGSTRKTTTLCTYDSNGNLIKEGKTVYTILKKDRQGNWISRKYKNDYGEIVNDSRTITYWDYDSGTESKNISTESEKVYDIVNGDFPSFPGGKSALQEYIVQNLKYPAEAVKNKKEGKVIVSFVVMKDGSVSNIVVAKSADPLLDKEAVRVVSIMPKWTPGTNDGQPVNVKYMFPISFKL